MKKIFTFKTDSDMDGWTMPLHAFSIKGKTITFTAHPSMKFYLEMERITVQKLGRYFTLPTMNNQECTGKLFASTNDPFFLRLFSH